MSDITNNDDHVEAVEADVSAVEVAPTTSGGVDVDSDAAPVEVLEEAPAAASAPESVPATRSGPVITSPVVKAAKPVAVNEDDGRTNPRKVREGIVVSNKMDMTLVVAVNERVSHPRYGKTVQRTKKLYVHDEKNDAKVGDRVRVQETRPLSKLKRWRLTEVVERAR